MAKNKKQFELLTEDEVELIENLSFGNQELAIHLMVGSLIMKNFDVIEDSKNIECEKINCDI